LLIIIFLF